MKYLIYFLLLVTGDIFADYQPPSVFPTVKRAKVTVSYSGGKFVYTPDCLSTDIAVTPTKSDPANIYCHTCPADFPNIDYVIVNNEPDYQRPICQKPCKANEIRAPRFGGFGFTCQTCNEVYKEWRSTDQGLKCLTKTCPEPLVLDTKDGQCKEFDVTCPPWQEKVYAFKNSRPYCTSFCQTGEFRNKLGSCQQIPTCPVNHKRVFEEFPVKTTIYKEYSCELVACSSNQNMIDGQCFDRCNANEIFNNGICEKKQNKIVEAIDRLSLSVSDSFYDLYDDLESFLNDFYISLDSINSSIDDIEVDEIKNNENNENNENLDTTALEADISYNEIKKTDLNEYLFSIPKQCPVDRTTSIWGYEFSFSFSKLCISLNLLGNLVLLLSYISAYYIIVRK
jgi:hypothetical protein